MRSYKLTTLRIPDFEGVSSRQFDLCRPDSAGAELLHRICLQMDRLAVMGDASLRCIWIEVPRGEPGGRATCGGFSRPGNGGGEGSADSRDCPEDRKGRYPRESMWLELWTSHQEEPRRFAYESLTVSDGRSYSFDITANGHDDNRRPWRDVGFLGLLLSDLTALVDSIVADPDAYNAYLEASVPKQLRRGKIPRREFCSLTPFLRTEFSDPEGTREALKAAMSGRLSGRGASRMTVRDYCRWFRVGCLAFLGRTDANFGGGLSDIEFYSRNGICAGSSWVYEFDPDSEEDFSGFAVDHYCELFLTRTNIFARQGSDGLWYIEPAASYYQYYPGELDMIAALYRAGAPLSVRDPERALALLDGTDSIAVRPDTYHDYVSGAERDCGGSVSIPYPEEVCPEDGWTEAMLEAVIARVQWEPLRKVLPNAEPQPEEHVEKQDSGV